MLRILIWGMIVFTVAGCDDTHQQHASGVTRIDAWFHTGQERERQTIQDQVARFNQLDPAIQVKLTLIPERSYNSQVQAAAIAGDLPDILEFDGPYLYNYVWQGHLKPLDKLLPDEVKADLLPSIIEQGSYQGHLYGIGTFDSGLGFYARRSRLQHAGVRIPKGPENAWTAKEFKAVLKALARKDDDGAVLDLKLNYGGEWFSYAFSPLIQSAGGDLIDRNDYQSAAGKLNGPAAVSAMQAFQSWIHGGYVDPNLDDGAFTSGRVALSWAGHWEYLRYSAAAGDDLVVLPLPNMGKGSRTGQGSWVWGITATGPHADAAASFLKFLLQTDEVLAMADANGAVPATRSAITRSKLYRADGPLHLYVDQLTGGYAVPRPQTPAYPVITSAFQAAFMDIRNNGNVQAALDKAAAAIDQDIADNKGYR
jgi:multiple sugar transport system substrate-binding protein